MIYRLENTGKIIENITENIIEKEIKSLDENDNEFVILSKENNDLTYIQVAGNSKDGFNLEYQEEDRRNHYKAKNNKMRINEITNIFIKYFNNDLTWKNDFNWDRIYVEPNMKKKIPFYSFFYFLLLVIWVFIIFKINMPVIIFTIVTGTLFYSIVSKLFLSKKNQLAKRKKIESKGHKLLAINSSFVSIFLSVNLIRSFWYVKLNYFWLILGVLIFIFGLFALIPVINKKNIDLILKDLNENEIKKEAKKDKIKSLVSIVLLLIWTYSWYGYIFTLFQKLIRTM